MHDAGGMARIPNNIMSYQPGSMAYAAGVHHQQNLSGNPLMKRQPIASLPSQSPILRCQEDDRDDQNDSKFLTASGENAMKLHVENQDAVNYYDLIDNEHATSSNYRRHLNRENEDDSKQNEDTTLNQSQNENNIEAEREDLT